MEQQIISITPRSRARMRVTDFPAGGVLRLVVAALLCGAAGIHFGVTGEHFAEWTGYGVFFLVLAFFQVLVAFALRPSLDERFYFAAALTQLAVVGLWIASRTTGLPVGPAPWEPEGVGIPDTAASAFELVAAALLLIIPWIRRTARMSLLPAAAMTILTVVAVVSITGWSLIAAAQGSPGDTVPAASMSSGH